VTPGAEHENEVSVTTDNRRIESVAQFHVLGRSGLRVSPLCLGTLTFGNESGIGSTHDSTCQIFHRYLDAGGNFIDTADGYSNGKSEEVLGQLMKESHNRDRVVVSTKYTWNMEPGNPNAGGNGRKHIMRAVEGSLRRLQTDYIDLYWLHFWDTMTPAEEVMSSLDSLVRSGKVRYIGLSDVPAWYLARAQTLAELRGWERICGLQLEYSLAERSIEREHLPAAMELGIGLCAFSPLAHGLLTGKYTRHGEDVQGAGRLQTVRHWGVPLFEKFTERNWPIVDALVSVARELERPPSQVALNWVATRPGVSSTIIGATTLPQLDSNLMSLDFEIPEELSRKLEAVGRPDVIFPYSLHQAQMLAGLAYGGAQVRAEPRWYRGS
jgi:aryl-alcohol dehydrogenase-like predicted oxidoreductase